MRLLVSLLGVAGLACGHAHAQSQAQRRLVWSDEFAAGALDTRCWRPETTRPHNNADELQRFTASPRNIGLGDGALVIAAHKETTGAGAAKRHYTSAQISTVDAAYWTYGYYEARIKAPRGPGSFPAFWMMPQHNEWGWWPNSGEIDIWEYIGRDQKTVYTALHYKGDDWKGGVLHMERPLYEDYHVYGFEWLPSRMRWYVDGKLMWEKTSWKSPDPARKLAPFDTPFYLILNLSVGGRWPLPPTAKTPWPLQLEVDYVRVYAIDGVKDPRPRVLEEPITANHCPLNGPAGSATLTIAPQPMASERMNGGRPRAAAQTPSPTPGE